MNIQALLLVAASMTARATAEFTVTSGTTEATTSSTEHVSFVKQWTLNSAVTGDTIDSIDLELAGRVYVSYVSNLPTGVLGYVNVSGDSQTVVDAVTVSNDDSNDNDNDDANDTDGELNVRLGNNTATTLSGYLLTEIFLGSNGAVTDVKSQRSAQVVVEDGVLVTSSTTAELQVEAGGSSAVYVSAASAAVSVRQLQLDAAGTSTVQFNVGSVSTTEEVQIDTQGSAAISLLASSVEAATMELEAQNTGTICIGAQTVTATNYEGQDASRISMPNASSKYTSSSYVVNYRMVGRERFREIELNASADVLETSIILPNLTRDSMYELRIGATSYSPLYPKKIIRGRPTDLKKIVLETDCDKMQSSERQSHNNYNFAVLVGIICSCFGIILIIMAFILWSRKCFHAAYYYLDDPPNNMGPPQIDWEVPVEIAGEIRAAVPVNEFFKHTSSLHADGDIGFSREYEAIQNECVTDDLPSEHSQHPENKRKNRYLNIIAYDHSRVHLHPTQGQKKYLDYINANFIDGYQKSRAFIGTQGPLPDTFDCFWRMIWEQRVSIIVMITNLVERGRRKCDMYWPKEGTEVYGVIQVKLISEEVMATYTVRTFHIKHLKLKKKKHIINEKIVYQYHYTNWPDHGTPDHPLPVLDFIKKSSAANPADAGPIVVHCSAGVGRTGTYIVLDAMLKQIQAKGVVNVFGFLLHIRNQRNFLVQTEEQYIFIHDALVEAIMSGETNLRVEQIQELKKNTTYLEQLYKNIIQFQAKDIHISSAMKQVNSIKNRGAIFPVDSYRVHLTPKPGEEGSDYINATWLHGFRKLKDFIVTQHPMNHTVKDFWQMIWDHNVQTIVLLSSLDEINFAQFWPADDTTAIESDNYRMRFLSKSNQSDYVTRDFIIQSTQHDYELSVKMLHYPNWPNLANVTSIYDFIADVHERASDYRNGPIVIIDRYGGAQACTFAAVSSLAIEMEYDNTANIYQYVKLYHNKRPGVWTSSEDIRMIFRILAEMPSNLNLLQKTQIPSEIEDLPTATPDLYSKICSNGNISSTLNSNMQSTSEGCPPGMTLIMEVAETHTERNGGDSLITADQIQVLPPPELISSNLRSETDHLSAVVIDEEQAI